MPESAAFCPGCGRSVQVIERARGTVGVLPEPVAGAVAYFTIIPAVIFLLVEPYRRNRFVRFHSFQSLGVFFAAIVAWAVLRIAGVTLSLIPLLGHLLVFLISMLVGLAFFLAWLVLVVKALQGERFKLSVVGDFAEKQADAS